jgi:hypothetical protein
VSGIAFADAAENYSPAQEWRCAGGGLQLEAFYLDGQEQRGGATRAECDCAGLSAYDVKKRRGSAEICAGIVHNEWHGAHRRHEKFRA